MNRVAVVITVLSYGGAQTMLSELLNHIDKKEFSVKLFVLQSAKGTRIEQEIASYGIDCEFLDMSSTATAINKIKAMLRFTKALDQFQPDLVHAHLDTFYSPLYCYWKKVPFVFTVHSFPNRILHKKFRFLLEQLRKKNLLQIVGCAECVTKAVPKELGEEYEDVCVTIYNPIDITKFSMNMDEKQGDTFVHVGRMEKIKNQMLIIKGFERLHKIHKEVKLIMIGDGPLMNDYLEYVNQHSLISSIAFLGNRSDVANVLSKCDYFVLSSNSECCPISVLEAIASGLPVVSTDVGGVKEIVKDAGILCSVGSVEEFFEAMKTIYEHAEIREQMKKRTQEIIRFFDVKRIVPQYEDIYHKCLKR